VKRRAFITLLGGAAAWPLAARAQQQEGIRQVGLLTTENDSEHRPTIRAFQEELAKLGWVENRNLRIYFRFFRGDPDYINTYAAELVSVAPDVIVSVTSAATKAVQQRTQAIPIVFAGVGDPLVNGIVRNVARPEGNTTGVTNLPAGISGKWLQLLKDMAPWVERVGIVYNARIAPDEQRFGYIRAVEGAAELFAIQTATLPFSNTVDFIRAIVAFAAKPNCGIVVTPPALVRADRDTLRGLVATHRLPAIYHARYFAAEGGLLAYGASPLEMYRRAARYVDRILRGAKPGELAIEYPTKFELVINLQTARAMGLTIPTDLLVAADELIE
jgi:putative tryptophan/tyrosine transport system substrate-binding protein